MSWFLIFLCVAICVATTTVICSIVTLFKRSTFHWNYESFNYRKYARRVVRLSFLTLFCLIACLFVRVHVDDDAIEQIYDFSYQNKITITAVDDETITVKTDDADRSHTYSFDDGFSDQDRLAIGQHVTIYLRAEKSQDDQPKVYGVGLDVYEKEVAK